MPPPHVNKIPKNEDPAKDKTGTLAVPLKFLDQDYQELKKSCFTNKKRYDDEKFPSDSSSIDPKKKLKLDLGQIKWLRPSVTCKEKQVRLVRVLNPWGAGEWTGNWSDKSPLWNDVSEMEQSKCRSLANDGEFWMSMEDFSRNFSQTDICCLSPDFLDSWSECSWTSTCYNDRWVAGTTAGGCLRNIDSFWKNPQFRVKIEALDKECTSGQCPENILVSLMQNHEKRNRSEVSNYAIGFSVFAIPPEMKDKKLPDKFIYQKRSVADSGNFISTRHVMRFFKLEPGEYLIVPSTFNPNECAKFILSVFSKSESHKRN